VVRLGAPGDDGNPAPDLDGVLLNSAGYHRSLVETVRRVSHALGFGEATLSAEDIEAFELRDITAEWDSSAIVAALLLVGAWRTDPGARLPRRPPLEARPTMNRSFADVLSFLADFDGTIRAEPLAQAETLLMRRLDGASPGQRFAVSSILRGAHNLNESLTFWLVHNLGRPLQAVHGLPAGLETSPSWGVRPPRPRTSGRLLVGSMGLACGGDRPSPDCAQTSQHSRGSCPPGPRSGGASGFDRLARRRRWGWRQALGPILRRFSLSRCMPGSCSRHG
jgi:hypothetical protein